MHLGKLRLINCIKSLRVNSNYIAQPRGRPRRTGPAVQLAHGAMKRYAALTFHKNHLKIPVLNTTFIHFALLNKNSKPYSLYQSSRPTPPPSKLLKATARPRGKGEGYVNQNGNLTTNPLINIHCSIGPRCPRRALSATGRTRC